MRLFFETAGQAQRFLFMAPLGFLVAMCLDADAWAGRLRPVVDVLLLLACGFLMLTAIAIYRESGLRAYHLLGLLVGAILYMQGVGKVIRGIARRISAIRQEKRTRM